MLFASFYVYWCPVEQEHPSSPDECHQWSKNTRVHPTNVTSGARTPEFTPRILNLVFYWTLCVIVCHFHLSILLRLFTLISLIQWYLSGAPEFTPTDINGIHVDQSSVYWTLCVFFICLSFFDFYTHFSHPIIICSSHFLYNDHNSNNKKSLKIPKEWSESVNRRTDNTMTKRKRYKRTNNDLQNY